MHCESEYNVKNPYRIDKNLVEVFQVPNFRRPFPVIQGQRCYQVLWIMLSKGPSSTDAVLPFKSGILFLNSMAFVAEL
jgi:hypothetical protein